MSKEDHVNDRSTEGTPTEEEAEANQTPLNPSTAPANETSGGTRPPAGGETSNS